MTDTQNTRTFTSNIPVHALISTGRVRRLMRVSKDIASEGYDLSFILNRSVDLWLGVEAPVYRAYVKEQRLKRRKH